MKTIQSSTYLISFKAIPEFIYHILSLSKKFCLSLLQKKFLLKAISAFLKALMYFRFYSEEKNQLQNLNSLDLVTM